MPRTRPKRETKIRCVVLRIKTTHRLETQQSVAVMRCELAKCCDLCIRVFCTEHGRTGNKVVCASFSCQFDGLTRNTTVNLDRNLKTRSIDRFAGTADLRDHRVNKRLTAKTGFHRSSRGSCRTPTGCRRTERYRLRTKPDRPLNRCCGARVQGGAELPQLQRQSDRMATSFRICGRPTIRVFDHQVGINRKDLRGDDGLDDGQAPRQVRNKMVVHHVNVSNVRRKSS